MLTGDIWTLEYRVVIDRKLIDEAFDKRKFVEAEARAVFERALSQTLDTDFCAQDED